MEQHANLSNKSELYREVNRSAPDDEGYDALVRGTPDGHCALDVLVRGVHCAGCIQKIESVLLESQGVENARLNFSTGRLHIEWNGKEAHAANLVAAVRNLGYGVQPYDAEAYQSSAAEEERFLLLCLGVAGFAMGNIMLLSVGLWTTTAETMGVMTRDLMHWISALIALPTIIYAGRPFFFSALGALKNGHTNMDVPISIALVLASGMSLFETFHHGEHVYFDSAIMLLFFLLIGRYLDMRARKNARSAATDLLSTLSGFAHVVDELTGKIKSLPIRDLKAGMMLTIAAGEKFPVDAVVIKGVSEIDTALVTGETLPRAVKPDEEVYAGTLNLSAPLKVRVAKAAEDSLLADIVRLMEKAGQGQARYVRIADRAARLYTPVVHTLAIAAFIGWWWFGGVGWQGALMIAVTVLIITCPCALGLAVPVVQVLASGRLLKTGVLVKSGDSLERLAGIDTVIFDKTGTLTLGRPVLSEGSYSKRDLQVAASLARHSHHPLSKALAAAYEGSFLDMEQVKEIPGQGLSGIFEGQEVRLGSRAYCGDATAEDRPQTQELWLWIGQENPRYFLLSDTLRIDSSSVIEALKSEGLRICMLSGDRQAVVKHMADALGIEDARGDLKPDEKFRILEEMHARGQRVLMVGDGLNDAPVLAGADISMAPGTAIDMAQNAADMVFMGEGLDPVYKAYRIAKVSQLLVKQNFLLAGLYNACAIPLALAGMVTPLIAAIAMSGSSLLVIANAFRLNWKLL